MSIIDRVSSLEFKQQSLQLLCADQQFFAPALMKFSLAYTDSDKSKQEPELCTMYEQLFMDSFIVTDSDALCSFMHSACHLKCDHFWTTCPIPMQVMPLALLDIVEEAYAQRLVQVVMPSVYDLFPLFVRTYDVWHGFSTANRRLMHSMLTDRPKTNTILDKVVTELYRRDPLKSQTFNWFIQEITLSIVNDQKVRQLVDEYVTTAQGMM